MEVTLFGLLELIFGRYHSKGFQIQDKYVGDGNGLTGSVRVKSREMQSLALEDGTSSRKAQAILGMDDMALRQKASTSSKSPLFTLPWVKSNDHGGQIQVP